MKREEIIKSVGVLMGIYLLVSFIFHNGDTSTFIVGMLLVWGYIYTH
jgi:hypothetical protein